MLGAILAELFVPDSGIQVQASPEMTDQRPISLDSDFRDFCIEGLRKQRRRVAVAERALSPYCEVFPLHARAFSHGFAGRSGDFGRRIIF
jgi:hypothetical protein